MRISDWSSTCALPIAQRAHQRLAEGGAVMKALEGESVPRRPIQRLDVKLLLEGGGDPQPGDALQPRQGLFEDRPGAAIPGRAVEIDDVTQQQAKIRRVAAQPHPQTGKTSVREK